VLALLGQFAPQILGAVFTAAAGLITSLLNSQRDQALGAQTTAAAVQNQALAAEAAVAKAEVDAPQTTKDSEAAMDKGTF
jgi:hypothetical protein